MGSGSGGSSARMLPSSRTSTRRLSPRQPGALVGLPPRAAREGRPPESVGRRRYEARAVPRRRHGRLTTPAAPTYVRRMPPASRLPAPSSWHRRPALWVAAALTWLVSAVPAEAQTPKRGGVFRVPAPEAVNLDPHLSSGFSTQIYASLVYGQLVRFPAGPEASGSGDYRILPDIAEKWEFPNPTTVTFTRRKGVRFHNKTPVNGREVTAEDVKYSLERFRARSPARHRLEPVQSIEVVDRSTVKLVLREPFAPLLNHLANPAQCAIMPRELEE